MNKQFSSMIRAVAYERLRNGDIAGFKFCLSLLGERYEKGMLIHGVA